MDLILWRHAEAEMFAAEGGDLSRALTSKGERQARRMAEWLNQRLPASARILSSPALRCRTTAEALGRDFKIVPALAPDASPQAVLDVARWPSAAEAVLVCGHQPTLGQVAAQLLAGQEHDWAVKKGRGLVLRSRERDGVPEVTLVAMQAPDCL